MAEAPLALRATPPKAITATRLCLKYFIAENLLVSRRLDPTGGLS
jgi:hypothetical protein